MVGTSGLRVTGSGLLGVLHRDPGTRVGRRVTVEVETQDESLER